jgi:molybdopterin-guanine dinucleotide biosynthesis protein A
VGGPDSDSGAWAAVILAGGTGARLDGADKAALEHGGLTLLDRALAAVSGAAETVVVGDRVPASRPVVFTRESPVGGGPLAALCAGVDALEGAAPLVVVLAVDMPHVTTATVERLREAVGDAGAAWLVDGSGRRQLAGAVLRERVVAFAEPHGLPMRALSSSGSAIEVPAIGNEADDVDTWSDVARLRGRET